MIIISIDSVGGKIMKIHIAQKDETLWNIAKKYNVSFEELKNNNTHLSSPDAVYPGMKIKVPISKVLVSKKVEQQTIRQDTDIHEIEEETLYRNAETTIPKNIFTNLLPNQVAKPTIPENEQEIAQNFMKPPFAIPIAPPPPIVNTTQAQSTLPKESNQQINSQDATQYQVNSVHPQQEYQQGYQQGYYQPQQYYQQDCGCNSQYQPQYGYYQGYQQPQILPAPIPGYFQPYGNYVQQPMYQQPQYPTFQEPQVQPQHPLTPAYPFPITNFQGQGYPDYYRDVSNHNFGVPPIDDEEL